MSKREMDQQLTAALRDPGCFYLVSTDLVGLAGWNVTHEIVAIAQHQGLAEVGIRLDRDSELRKQFPRHPDQGEVAYREQRHMGVQLARALINPPVATIRIFERLHRAQLLE